MAMQSVQALSYDFASNKKKRKHTPHSTHEVALVISKKFLAHLANEEFFGQSIEEGLSPRLAAMLEERFTRFGAKNPIMRTPAGALSLPHIEYFIERIFSLKKQQQRIYSKFEIVALVRDYQGANNV